MLLALLARAAIAGSGLGPLYVARRLRRFASEDVGAAIPKPLLARAVALKDACTSLGSRWQNTALAQLVVALCAHRAEIEFQSTSSYGEAAPVTREKPPYPFRPHPRNAANAAHEGGLGYGNWILVYSQTSTRARSTSQATSGRDGEPRLLSRLPRALEKNWPSGHERIRR